MLNLTDKVYTPLEESHLIDIPIDYSALSQLICKRRYQLNCVWGCESTDENLEFGKGGHYFLEMRGKQDNRPNTTLAMEILGRVKADQDKLLRMMSAWDSKYPPFPDPLLDLEGHPLVEWKFAFPYAVIANKYRIVLCGTVDRMFFQGKVLFFRDYKFLAGGSKYQQEKATNNYLASFQLPFYLYCLQYHLAPFFPPQIREALERGNVLGQYLLVWKNSIPTGFDETSTIRAWSRDEVEAVIHNGINEALPLHELESLAPAEGSLYYDACRICSFNGICLTQDPQRRLNIINKIPRRQYNPLHFR